MERKGERKLLVHRCSMGGFSHPSSVHLRKHLLRKRLTTGAGLFTSMVIYLQNRKQIRSQEEMSDMVERGGLENSKSGEELQESFRCSSKRR